MVYAWLTECGGRRGEQYPQNGKDQQENARFFYRVFLAVKKPVLLGGGGGKYLPPALRAAAKAKADASLSAVTKRTGGAGKYVPPAMRAAARAEAAPSLTEALCGSSSGKLRPPSTASQRNGLGGDNM